MDNVDTLQLGYFLLACIGTICLAGIWTTLINIQSDLSSLDGKNLGLVALNLSRLANQYQNQSKGQKRARAE